MFHICDKLFVYKSVNFSSQKQREWKLIYDFKS